MVQQKKLMHIQEIEYLIEQSWQQHYRGLCNMAYKYVHNEQDAMDIVQESAYKALKSCHSLREPQYVVTWLYQIVRNESVSFLRKNKQICVPLYEADGEQEASYADLDLACAIAQLTASERIVIALRFFEGWSFQQMAEMLKENISTVKSRVYRALQKIKVLLEEPCADW